MSFKRRDTAGTGKLRKDSWMALFARGSLLILEGAYVEINDIIARDDYARKKLGLIQPDQPDRWSDFFTTKTGRESFFRCFYGFFTQQIQLTAPQRSDLKFLKIKKKFIPLTVFSVSKRQQSLIIFG